MPFTSSVESVSVSRLRHSVTTEVKFVDAVCPAEFTVMAGIEVPAGVAVLAVNTSDPEGLCPMPRISLEGRLAGS
jgi:hypothetical protein